MAEIHLQVDEGQLCVRNAQLSLQGVRRDHAGHVVDHVDLILPWTFQRAVANLDAIDYHSLEDGAVS